jgi:hypothetical protein
MPSFKVIKVEKMNISLNRERALSVGMMVSHDVWEVKMPQVIISISLLTYLIQQLVNNIQTITTPLSFVFLGVFNSLVMKEISKD